MDLLEAYDSAVKHSNVLRSSVASREALRYQTDASKGAWLPQVSAGLSTTQPFGNAVSTDLTGSWNINVSQSIFNQALKNQIRSAENNETKGNLALEQAKMQLIYDVAEAYLNVLNTQQTIFSNDGQIRFLEAQLANARAQFDVGLITSGNLLQIQSQLDQAYATKASSQASLNTAMANYVQVTGSLDEPTVPLQYNSTLPSLEPQDIDFWVSQAKANSLSIKQGKIDLENAAIQVESARAGNLPTVNLSASYGGAVDDGLNNDSGSIGVSVSMPLYTGGINQANTKAAAYNRESTRYNLNQTTNQIVQTLKSQFSNLSAQSAQVQALAKSIRSNKVALESIQAGYEIGTQTIAELLDAESQLRTSETDFIVARQN
jgi:outer membrane protein